MAKQPKIRVCKNCNNPLPEKATVCPSCGAKNKSPSIRNGGSGCYCPDCDWRSLKRRY